MKKTIFLFVFLLFYLIYGTAFLGKASLKINNTRYHFLFDDAMISMKYAENFAKGYGIKWNKSGEKVEGYTNFLWMLYMSIPHYLNIHKSKTSLFIKLSALVFLILNLILIFKIIDNYYKGDFLLLFFALFLIAFYLPLNYWSLLGMEVSILTLLLTIIVYLIIKSLEEKKFDIKIYFTLGMMTLIRIDMFYAFWWNYFIYDIL